MASNCEDDETAPFHYEGGIPIFDGKAEREGKERAKQKERDEGYEDRQLSIQRHTLYTQIALVVFGLLGAGFSGYQARTSRIAGEAAQSAALTASSTLYEMQHGSGAVDTHTLAEQAKTQVQQTTALASAAGQQAMQTLNLANEVRRQSELTRQQVIASRAANDMTRRLVATAQQTFDTSNRPYVGVSGTSLSFQHYDGLGNFVDDQTRTEQSNRLLLTIYWKNFGTVPARKFKPSLDLRVRGEVMAVPMNVTSGTAVFPSEISEITDYVDGEPYADVVAGRAVLQYNISFSYVGVSDKPYQECERYQYLPSSGVMLDLGARCDDPWDSATLHPLTNPS